MRLELEAPDNLRQLAIEDVMRVDRVLGQFLAFVRSGEAPAGPLVDAVTLVERLARRYAGRHVAFAAVPVGIPALPAELFDRVADNLIDNALSYGRPPVEVRLCADGPGVVLQVADHGPGIAPVDQAAAMSPFVRLDASRSGDGHSGLGLPTVARLLGSNGGGLTFARRDGLFLVCAALVSEPDGIS
jgi:two-component system, OmpR family, osmolarity sensor histidine kinase EnvZ